MRNEARISELKKQPHAILKDPSVSSFVDQKVQKKKELSTALTKKISTLVLNNGITDVVGEWYWYDDVDEMNEVIFLVVNILRWWTILVKVILSEVSLQKIR